MTRHDPKSRFLHMRDYSAKAVSLVKGKEKEIVKSDDVLCLALTRLVELIGEAASQVPPREREKYPSLPWPQMINMRNRLIHAYDDVDFDILWDTLTINLPKLIIELDKII